MTLDASGNLGIGVTSGGARLEIGSSGTVLAKISSSTNSSFRGVQFGLNADSNVYGSVAMEINGGEFRTSAGFSGWGGFQTFYTNGSERARIDSSGNLLVGTTSSNETAANGFIVLGGGASKGYVASSMAGSTNAAGASYHLYSTGAGAYRFYVGLGGTIFATSTTITGISDVRVKENIRDLDDGLAAVMALKPRKFDWKAGKGKGIKDDRGFIAQEFEQVFPDMIDEWKDPAPEGEEPYKAVNANLIPTLVKAIQEQQALINAQQAALQTLTARVAALESI
jgi:hypothetical protein